MAMYQSTSREVAFAYLPVVLRHAISDHAAQRQLLLDETRCWITHSVNPPSESFFGRLLGRRANPTDPDAAHDTAVVLHASHLLIGRWGEASGATVLSVALAMASISRTSPQLAALGGAGTEPGMFVSGFAGEAGRPGSLFVKLGDDEAGQGCQAAVEQAILTAKNR